jgi:hypothetical protein
VYQRTGSYAGGTVATGRAPMPGTLNGWCQTERQSYPDPPVLGDVRKDRSLLCTTTIIHQLQYLSRETEVNREKLQSVWLISGPIFERITSSKMRRLNSDLTVTICVIKWFFNAESLNA